MIQLDDHGVLNSTPQLVMLAYLGFVSRNGIVLPSVGKEEGKKQTSRKMFG